MVRVRLGRLVGIWRDDRSSHSRPCSMNKNSNCGLPDSTFAKTPIYRIRRRCFSLSGMGLPWEYVRCASKPPQPWSSRSALLKSLRKMGAGNSINQHAVSP